MDDYLSFEAGWHANIGETATMMAIDEELVDLDAVEVDDPDMPTDVPNPGALLDPLLIGKGSFYRVSESGTWGDPSDATAERGEEYSEVITCSAWLPSDVPRKKILATVSVTETNN